MTSEEEDNNQTIEDEVADEESLSDAESLMVVLEGVGLERVRSIAEKYCKLLGEEGREGLLDKKGGWWLKCSVR